MYRGLLYSETAIGNCQWLCLKVLPDVCELRTGYGFLKKGVHRLVRSRKEGDVLYIRVLVNLVFLASSPSLYQRMLQPHMSYQAPSGFTNCKGIGWEGQIT